MFNQALWSVCLECLHCSVHHLLHLHFTAREQVAAGWGQAEGTAGESWLWVQKCLPPIWSGTREGEGDQHEAGIWIGESGMCFI